MIKKLVWIKFTYNPYHPWYLIPYIDSHQQVFAANIPYNGRVIFDIRSDLTVTQQEPMYLDFTGRNKPTVIKELTKLAHEMWPDFEIDLTSPKEEYKSLQNFNV
jgi:hypothetical protein